MFGHWIIHILCSKCIFVFGQSFTEFTSNVEAAAFTLQCVYNAICKTFTDVWHLGGRVNKLLFWQCRCNGCHIWKYHFCVSHVVSFGAVEWTLKPGSFGWCDGSHSCLRTEPIRCFRSVGRGGPRHGIVVHSNELCTRHERCDCASSCACGSIIWQTPSYRTRQSKAFSASKERTVIMEKLVHVDRGSWLIKFDCDELKLFNCTVYAEWCKQGLTLTCLLTGHCG